MSPQHFTEGSFIYRVGGAGGRGGGGNWCGGAQPAFNTVYNTANSIMLITFLFMVDVFKSNKPAVNLVLN